jgi:hypothetical protein
MRHVVTVRQKKRELNISEKSATPDPAGLRQWSVLYLKELGRELRAVKAAGTGT